MTQEKNLSGLAKAAIILLAMDKPNANNILNMLNKEEASKITALMSQLENIDIIVKNDIISDFTKNLKKLIEERSAK